jgi:hypothetical protein
MEAWHSERFQALRRANLAEDVRGTVCESCIAYDDAPQSVGHPVAIVKTPAAR